MAIQLDHTIVPSHTQVASAKLLAELLGATGVGPFSPVYVNNGFTLDFIGTDEDFPIYHFCFRVEPTEFDAILARIKAAGIPLSQHTRRANGYANWETIRQPILERT